MATQALLTANEKIALTEMLKNHPDLSSVPTWATLDDTDTYYGGSWNKSFDNLCINNGYEIFGVFCLNGHVAGLRVYGIVDLYYDYTLNAS